MTDFSLFFRFSMALGIGFLIGLQRTYDHQDEPNPSFAGIRTFSFFGLLGAMGAFLADIQNNDWLFIAVFIATALLINQAYWITSQKGDIGLTTETASLATLLIGAICYWDYIPLAAALGVTITILLSFKAELHRFAQQITTEDIYATLKFAVITAIILPVLPNQTFGPFAVLNPYKIWLMAVFISGMNFLGYILIKLVGSQKGIGLTGILGGMVSSTAVTLTFSQRSQKTDQFGKQFALAIMLSWTVMFIRVLVEIGVVHLPLLQIAWLPISLLAAIALAYCAYLYFSPSQKSTEEITISNPFELGPAIQFALLYGLILFASKAAQAYFGDTGIYIASILAGLTDVDAITLGLSEQASNGTLDFATATRGILLALMSNSLVKGGIVIFTSAPSLRKVFAPGLIILLVVGTAALILI